MDNDPNHLKVGRMIWSLTFLKDVYANKKEILGEFIILEAETDWNSELVKYTAISEHFNKISETENIPFYTVAIEVNDGKTTLKVTQTKDSNG